MRASRAERLALGLTAAAATLAAAVAGPAVARADTTADHGVSPTAALLTPHRAYRAPAPGARVLTTVAAQRPITGVRTVVPVLGQRTDPDGRRWLQVLLPGRPNGRTGWIDARDTRLGRTAYRLVVDRSSRTVTVVHRGARVERFAAVIGKAATPTPVGRFFVEETVDLGGQAAGGPIALALSARSNVLQEFDGGPGQIAIHGRDGLGGVLGEAQSHGCVRLATRSVAWLGTHIRPGVPVRIQP